MPHPAYLSKRRLRQKFRASSSPPLSQPTLARYGLTVRATVRACTFKNATATTQAKLTHGLFRTRSAHGLSQTTIWQPAPLHSPASPSSHSVEARRDRRRWPGKKSGLPPQIVAASHPKILSRPFPQPHGIFRSASNFVRGRGERCSL